MYTVFKKLFRSDSTMDHLEPGEKAGYNLVVKTDEIYEWLYVTDDCDNLLDEVKTHKKLISWVTTFGDFQILQQKMIINARFHI